MVNVNQKGLATDFFFFLLLKCYLRFGVEINVSPESFGKLIIVDVL